MASEPVTAEEVERARNALLNDFEQAPLDNGGLASRCREFAAMGDWRLFFLYRDRLKKVTPEDVQRVAKTYLKPANRTLGMFMPTDAPDARRDPAVPDWQRADGYKGAAEACALGEAFDPSPDEHRSAPRAPQLVQRHAGRAAAQEDARRHASSRRSRCTGATRRA